MGLLVDGHWHDRWYDTAASGGRFIRSESQFRNWITASGEAGPNGQAGFAAEANRYHLYVNYACPWAHRTLIFRALKGLAPMIGVSVTHWLMQEHGWTFKPDPELQGDRLYGLKFLHELYTLADSKYSGRVTVPVLWDTKEKTIVNNESSDIIRIFNSAFDMLGARSGNYYPDHLKEEIDVINERVYRSVNNGVYKAGFATTQPAYDEAVEELFDALDWLESHLRCNRYLLGDVLTEADWRLFPTLLRFDPIYYGHFKCSKKRIVDYPNLWAYTRELYQWPGINETINLEHARRHYYQSHAQINPTQIVAALPVVDFSAPHNRDGLFS